MQLVESCRGAAFGVMWAGKTNRRKETDRCRRPERRIRRSRPPGWSCGRPSARLALRQSQEVKNENVVRRVYEDLPRYGEVKLDLPQQRYGAYDPSPVVSSRISLASSTNEAGTSTSLGPADRKS